VNVGKYMYLYICFVYQKIKPKCKQATTNVNFMRVYLRF